MRGAPHSDNRSTLSKDTVIRLPYMTARDEALVGRTSRGLDLDISRAETGRSRRLVKDAAPAASGCERANPSGGGLAEDLPVTIRRRRCAERSTT
jgi:hypothetical protein